MRIRSNWAFSIFGLFVFLMSLYYVSISNDAKPVFGKILKQIPHRLSNQKIHQNTTVENARTTTNDSSMVVLLWTRFFKRLTWDHLDPFFPNKLITVGNFSCQLTTDKTQLNDSQAVVFHGRNIDFEELPNSHRNDQLWIFYLLESPSYRVCSLSISDCTHSLANVGFNWIMNYHIENADSFFPYGRFLSNDDMSNTNEKIIQTRVTQFSKTFRSRPTDAVWLVSHCS